MDCVIENGSLQNYLSDIQVIQDLTFTVALVYLGYEIYSCTRIDESRVVFRIVIPESEYTDLRNQFRAGRLAISDVRTFGKKNSEVRRIVVATRRDGAWVNAELAKFARETNFKVS